MKVWLSNKRLLLPRPKNPAARKGLRYEAEVGKGLSRLAKAQSWGLRSQLGIEDESGTLHIPDYLLLLPTRTILLETKLRFTLAGISQLKRYAPLAYSLFRRPVVMCQVALHLTPEALDFPPVKNFEQLAAAACEGPFVYHLMFPGKPNL